MGQTCHFHDAQASLVKVKAIHWSLSAICSIEEKKTWIMNFKNNRTATEKYSYASQKDNIKEQTGQLMSSLLHVQSRSAAITAESSVEEPQNAGASWELVICTAGIKRICQIQCHFSHNLKGDFEFPN